MATYIANLEEFIVITSDAHCPFKVTWNDMFAWHFVFNENILFQWTMSYLKY